MHTIPSDLRDILALMQDTLFQAMHHDGFDTPTKPIELYYNAAYVGKLFPKPEDDCRVINNYTNTVEAPGYKYEEILFADLLGQLRCEADALYVSYKICDTYKGCTIALGVEVKCKHPPRYREALVAAGAIGTNSYEAIQCGV